MIRCVAIDDEPIALSIIKEYCQRYGEIELECFTSPVLGMECVNRISPDILFLDIELNSHNGIELARKVPPQTCVIFTTAYADYALDGFEVDAVDFLHKPIFYPRFERAISKALVKINHVVSTDSLGTLTLKTGHKTAVVNIEDIIYAESMDNYVRIFRGSGLPTVLTQMPLKEFATLLPDGYFARVHRSYIVSVKSISRYAARMITLRGIGEPIPVGRTYISEVNRILNIQPKKK